MLICSYFDIKFTNRAFNFILIKSSQVISIMLSVAVVHSIKNYFSREIVNGPLKSYTLEKFSTSFRNLFPLMVDVMKGLNL